MAKDLDKLKLELIKVILETEDEAVLRAALSVLQLRNTESLSKSAPLPKAPEPRPDVLPGGASPTGDAKDLQDDIDDIFNP